jgi:replicative DNA helicase
MRDPFPDDEPDDTPDADFDATLRELHAPRPTPESSAGLPDGALASLLASVAAPGRQADDRVATGFPSVDTMLGGGLRRGDLVVLAGEVGAGKSAMALAIALRASEAGHAAAFYSGEMGRERLVERALAIEGRARLDDLRRGALDAEGRLRVSRAAERLSSRLPWLAEIPPGGVDDVDAALKVLGPAELVVVDPLQWLASGERALAEEMASTVQELKAMAMRRGVAVLATSHLPVLDGGRQDPRPRLDDLGGHGVIKQAADVVLGLYRHAMYDSAPDVDGATELLVLKNRNGPTGYVDLFYYRQWMRFEDMLEPDR